MHMKPNGNTQHKNSQLLANGNLFAYMKLVELSTKFQQLN